MVCYAKFLFYFVREYEKMERHPYRDISLKIFVKKIFGIFRIFSRYLRGESVNFS